MADISHSPPVSDLCHRPHLHHHHHVQRHRVPSGGEDQSEDEELDPRIQVELEKLNKASEEINRLELELDDARAAFRQVLSDSTQRLNGLAKKLGACVDKARPYYEARMRLKEAHLGSQKAALRFERAYSMHEAAKEMVQLAEEGYKRREKDLDPTWQEMLNHATMKVNDAERERIESEACHQRLTVIFKKKDDEVQKLQRDLKRSIAKSKPYFEMKAKFNQVMEDHKRTVSLLEDDVGSAKSLYSQALRSLEAISDDIHRQRLERQQQLQLGVRGAGVGAEAPSPPHTWEKGVSIDGKADMFVYESGEDDNSPSCTQRNTAKGIVCHEVPYGKKTSVADEELPEGHFRTDPLNVVVFKTSDIQLSGSPVYQKSPSFQPPSVIHKQLDLARSSSYRAAIDGSQETGSDDVDTGTEIVDDDNVHTPTSTQLSFSAPLSASKRSPDFHRKRTPTPGSNSSTVSGSPKTSVQEDFGYSESSLARAQEWVNKSPVPQQRRFVKSKSLISSSSGLNPMSAVDIDLSSSVQTGVQKDVVRSDITPPLYQVVLTSSSSSVSPQQSLSRVNVLSHQQERLTPLSIPSRESTPDAQSPRSASPRQKSPKLQGLILRVDAGGINTSSSSPSSSQYVSTSSYDKTPTNTVVSYSDQSQHKPQISTQQPTLGVFTEPQKGNLASQQDPKDSGSDRFLASNVSPPAAAPLCSSSIPTSCPKPPTSLMSKLINTTATRISNYDSKTAPSTLSANYHLPATSRQKLSPRSLPPTTQQSPLTAHTGLRAPLSPGHMAAAASLRRQLNSPTFQSPPGDRIHVFGHSDFLSASSGHMAALLKVPSENSSDTESIASTGPMLDDDQVEFLTMDFTEQSIACDANDQEDQEYDAVHPEVLQRGNWARMSLPSNLSYLDGFLERTRQMSPGKPELSPDEGACDVDDGYLIEKPSVETQNFAVDEEGTRSNVAASNGDFQDRVDDFKGDGADVSSHVDIRLNNLACEDSRIVIEGHDAVVVAAPNEDVDNSSFVILSKPESEPEHVTVTLGQCDVEVNVNLCLNETHECVVVPEQNAETKNSKSDDAEESDLSVEASVVISPGCGDLEIVEGSTSSVAADEETAYEENGELFV